MTIVKGLFRPKALARVSSPESLDQLMHVVGARDWLLLLVFAALAALALLWSVVGRVPVAVTGRGILLHPRRVLSCQALGSGRIEALRVKAGDRVRKGDVLGHIDQSDRVRRIEEDRLQLVALEDQGREQDALLHQQARLQRQETTLERDLVAAQVESLRRTLADAEQRDRGLRRRVESLQRLRAEGLLAELSMDVLQAEEDQLENAARIAEAAPRMKQLEVQLKQAEARAATVAGQSLEARLSRRNRRRDLSARIEVDQLQLARYRDIVSEHTGTILEVVASVGQIVPAGAPVATLHAEGADGALIGVAYLPVGEGKKVRPGLRVQVTPDTVERQRFGGILGRVASVSPLPVTTEGALAVIGNAQVVQGLTPGGPYIEVTVELERDPRSASGYRWSSAGGPPLPVTAGVTHTSRVTVESRAPITYLMPFLREITGVY